MISDETRKKWQYKYDEIQSAIDSGKYEPNEWESMFLEDIMERLCWPKNLTMRQSIKLNELFERVI